MSSNPTDSDSTALRAQIQTQYEHNQPIYDEIQAKLDGVRDVVETAPMFLASQIMMMGDVYSIISANTHVDAHELAYTRLMSEDASDLDTIQEILGSTRATGEHAHAVMYYNNKAKYIVDNLQIVDYTQQVKMLREGEIDELHRYKVDHVKGIGMRKAAFSLAITGVTEKMCIDSNVARMFGIPDEDVYDGVVVEKYEAECERLRDQAPELVDEVSNFLWQWLVFDVAREVGVTTHDPWFLSLPGMEETA